MSTIYSDGVVNVSFVEGNARLELVYIDSIDKAGNAKFAVESVLVLSLPAFLRFHQQIDAMVSKLVEEGMLKETQGEGETAGGGAQAIAPSGNSPSASPTASPNGETEGGHGWKKLFAGKSTH
jgi:hypothetical protein